MPERSPQTIARGKDLATRTPGCNASFISPCRLVDPSQMMPRMRSFLLLSALVAATACGDRELATSPPQSPQSTARFANEAPPAHVDPACGSLLRNTPLH